MSSIRIEDKEIPLRLTWGGISLLRERLGVDWQVRLDQALETHDVDVIAEALAAASSDPEHSKGFWLRASPPVFDATLALQSCLSTAFFGADGAPSSKKKKRGLLGIFSRTP